MTELTLASLGIVISAATLLAILWSVAFPARRLWPPQSYTRVTPFVVWIPTLTLFLILILLGALGWGAIDSPKWLRFGFGASLIVVGHWIVWAEVRHFGIAQTGGAHGKLRTDGFYRFSRNPQYMADIVLIVGWIILSSAPWAVAVGVVAISVLVAAPFAEEPWLREQYGLEFEQYESRVNRFF